MSCDCPPLCFLLPPIWPFLHRARSIIYFKNSSHVMYGIRGRVNLFKNTKRSSSDFRTSSLHLQMYYFCCRIKALAKTRESLGLNIRITDSCKDEEIFSRCCCVRRSAESKRGISENDFWLKRLFNFIVSYKHMFKWH